MGTGELLAAEEHNTFENVLLHQLGTGRADRKTLSQVYTSEMTMIDMSIMHAISASGLKTRKQSTCLHGTL